VPSLAEIASPPLRAAPTRSPAAHPARALRPRPLLPPGMPMSGIGPLHIRDYQPLPSAQPPLRARADAPQRRAPELSAPVVASAPAEGGMQARGSRAQTPLPDGERAGTSPPGPVVPVPPGRMAGSPTVAPHPQPAASPAAPAAPDRPSAAGAPRRTRVEAASAGVPEPQPAARAPAGEPLRPAPPEAPAPRPTPGSGDATQPVAHKRPPAPHTEVLPEAPAAVVPDPLRRAGARAHDDKRSAEPGPRADRPLSAARAPRRQVAPALPPTPPQRIVHVHGPAPPPREPRSVATALRPSPPVAVSAATPPPATPRPAAPPELARAAVSIEIGRIEIRSATPRSAAPPPRRVTPARRHVIDPGLRFGGGRRW
jgi:hypothetical protein